MADYKVKSYSSYAKSMATPKSSGMSSKLDQKGYTPVSTTAKTTTAAAKTYQNTYASKDIYVPDAMSNKSKDKPVSGLGAKQTTAQSSVDVLDNKSDKTEKRFADAWINSGGSNYDGVYTGIPPSPVSVYETPSVQKMQDYLTGTSIMSALYEAQGLIDPATGGGLKIVEDRPMTAEELKKFAPIKELTEKNITVEELGAMDAPMQKATLESLGITNAQWVSSQGPRPMSLQEFDQATMDSVYYGRDPASIDPDTGQPIQSTADIVASEVAQNVTTPAASSFLDTDTFKLLKGVEGFKENPYSLNASSTLGGKPHKSGLTVGAGIDFGQHTKESLAAMGIPQSMITKADDAGWIGLNPDTIIDPSTGKPAATREIGHKLMYDKFKEQKEAGTLPSFTKEELDVATPAVYKPYEIAAKKQLDDRFGDGTFDTLDEGSKAVLTLEKYHRGSGYTLPDSMLEGAITGNPLKAAEGISWKSRRKNMKDWLKKVNLIPSVAPDQSLRPKARPAGLMSKG